MTICKAFCFQLELTARVKALMFTWGGALPVMAGEQGEMKLINVEYEAEASRREWFTWKRTNLRHADGIRFFLLYLFKRKGAAVSKKNFGTNHGNIRPYRGSRAVGRPGETTTS